MWYRLMITNESTNFLYLPDRLPRRSDFFTAFSDILNRRAIPWNLLPGTSDIWAVDYMPVQTGPNKFIRFTYAPDYLKSKRWIKTITDTDKVCDAIGICPAKSDIVLDGGNVIRGEGLVIMTDKIFAENPAYGRADLILQLESLLDARLIIIHWEPGDFTGHADGQVRHYDDNTVLINDYPKFYQPEFQSSLISALKEAGLTTIRVAYNTSGNHGDSAHGIYLNYFQMKGLIIVPQFGLSEEVIAFRQFEALFRDSTVETVDAREISKDGGVLNCVTWSISTGRGI